MTDHNEFNAGIIDEFRSNEGKVGGMFEGAPLIILHTTGARSGVERLAPLMYLPYEDRVFVFASKNGAHSHPAWYHNLKANPSVTVEVGSDTSGRTAVELDPDERDRIYAAQASLYPQFAEYEAGTDRVIPVIELV
jgi:deazaflavin-dependent oxidoreductase (nitroreductase family)